MFFKKLFVFLSCLFFLPQVVCAIDDYIIGVDDLIEISVYGESDLSIKARVLQDGTINYPLLGRIQVKGLNIMEAQQLIRERLAEDYLNNPIVSVNIKEYGKINILGEVMKPGQYDLKAHSTVVDAITLAGGFTKIASPNGTKVIRTEGGVKRVIKVPVNEILKSGNKKKDIQLKSGDVISVPESFL